MENTLLIGLSRQVALERQMDAVANNLANMNTAGFKSDNVLFKEHIMPIASMTEHRGEDRTLSYVSNPGIYRDYSTGDMQKTGNELDLAISGKGWFVVQTPDGEKFTRNGQLKLNAEGQIVTNDGFPVLSDGGTITLGASESGLVIAEDGSISTNQGQKGRLRVVSFANEEKLTKAGSNLYASKETPQPAEDARIMQGVFESSNVKPLVEMTRMIETIRAYTSAARSLDKASDLRRDAIQELGNTNI